MEFSEYSLEQIETQIDEFEDKVESLQDSIDYHTDSYTKDSIRTFLYQYQNYLRALKEERHLRLTSKTVNMTQEGVFEILNKFLTELKTKALFIKDSHQGKMHFQALYNQHASELLHVPNAVYQIYLPFTLNEELINVETHSGNGNSLSIDALSNMIHAHFKSTVYIQRVKPEKGRNIFDRNTNPETSAFLQLEKIDLWQGVMFYFFL